MKSIDLLSIFTDTQNLTLPLTTLCNFITYLPRGGFIFSSVVFAPSIVSLHNHLPIYCCTIISIVLYCIMRPYNDGPIGPLSYRHSSGVVRNPHSALAE